MSISRSQCHLSCFFYSWFALQNLSPFGRAVADVSVQICFSLLVLFFILSSQEIKCASTVIGLSGQPMIWTELMVCLSAHRSFCRLDPSGFHHLQKDLWADRGYTVWPFLKPLLLLSWALFCFFFEWLWLLRHPGSFGVFIISICRFSSLNFWLVYTFANLDCKLWLADLGSALFIPS